MATKVGRNYCNEHDAQCRRCNEANGCNNDAVIMETNPLWCLKCDSISDPNCILLSSPWRAPNCLPIASGYEDSCYLHVAANGTIRRGCVSEQQSEVETDCRDASICEKCTVNNCNAKVMDDEVCYECNSEVDGGDCQSNLGETMAKTCPLRVNKLGCYRYDDGGKCSVFFFEKDFLYTYVCVRVTFLMSDCFGLKFIS